MLNHEAFTDAHGQADGSIESMTNRNIQVVARSE